MYEYELMNVNTNERLFVWGDWMRELEHQGKNPAEWVELNCEYVD